jgi:BlaI family transcriptional regulator, penicillinase repressor
MKLTEPEWLVMNALWEKHPATVKDIVAQVSGKAGWAYTTVKTMLDRLTEKKIVRKTKQGLTGFYEPILTRPQARRTALRGVLDHAFDGAFGPLMHFLVEDEKLTPKQRQELIEILAQTRRTRGERK